MHLLLALNSSPWHLPLLAAAREATLEAAKHGCIGRKCSIYGICCWHPSPVVRGLGSVDIYERKQRVGTAMTDQAHSGTYELRLLQCLVGKAGDQIIVHAAICKVRRAQVKVPS